MQSMVVEDSDLRGTPVVTHCAPLSHADSKAALKAGAHRAETLHRDGLIEGAALFLQDETMLIGDALTPSERTLAHA